MSKTIELTHENFEEEVINSEIPVLVDFWAPWCAPCKMMAPVLDELAEELEGKIKIGKLDTEISEHQKFAILYQIQSIPNMKLFKNGKVVKDFIGFRPKENLKPDLEAELD
ncbi:MAG: thioredoxin [Nanoarchaeota archaeon]|nr:thioredoxin [Nanoarchaeota archaeon]